MTSYATLFTVDILHDYFLNHGSVVHEALDSATQEALLERYSVSAFMVVAPSEQARAKLAGQKMIFKATRTGFMVLVKTDPAAEQRPAVPFGADFRLSFKLAVSDPQFFNYTEIAAAAPSGVYRFGNGSANAAAGRFFLTAPIPGFDPTKVYEAGAIHTKDTGGVIDLFRAVRDTGPSATPTPGDWERIPADTWNGTTNYARNAVVLAGNRIYRARVDAPGTDLANAADWEAVTLLANQYASSADKMQLRPALFNLDLSHAALDKATIRVFRPGESDPAMERDYAAPSGTLAVEQVDLRNLAPGTYRLEVLDGTLAPVAGLGVEFRLDNEALRGGWFGVVEIGAGSGDFSLLDGGGALRSPRYVLRFLNRSTRWRYIFPLAQAVGAGSEVASEGSDPRVLVTSGPRPLTYFGTGIRLQADNAGTSAVSEEVLLPLPEPRRIRRDNQQWYSEIHMSNLSL